MSSSPPDGENYSEDPTVREDPELLPVEKQFNITATKIDDNLHVYTEIASVARALLSNPEAELKKVRTVDGDIVAVHVSLPPSCLSIKAVPRSYDSWHGVVSTGGDNS